MHKFNVIETDERPKSVLHTLSVDTWFLTVDTAYGMIRRLTCGARDILRPMPDECRDPRLSCCYPLLPFANRIDQAHLDFEGLVAEISPALPEPHGLHGTGWQSDWTAEDIGSDHLVLTLEGGADRAWPWRWRAEQRFSITQSGLTVDLTLTNIDAVSAPASIGLHPAFLLEAETRIETDIGGIWDCRPDLIPSGWRPITWPAIEAHPLDNCLTDWSGRAALRTPGQSPITLVADTGHLQVYRPKGENFLCLEPVTARPNVWTPIKNGPVEPPAILAPLERLSVTMTLSA